jgi:tetratricopeptide (TPR) repeat protein
MIETLSYFHYNKGLQLARADQLSEAVQELIKSVSYDCNNVNAWNLAGLSYYRLGKYKTAEYCWTQSVDKRQEGNTVGDYLTDLRNTIQETSPYFSQVAYHCRQKKHGQAAGIVSKEICSRFGSSADLQNYLGVLLVLDGKIKAAAKCWTNTLSIDKSNADARLYLNEAENHLSYKLLKLTEKLFKRSNQKEV